MVHGEVGEGASGDWKGLEKAGRRRVRVLRSLASVTEANPLGNISSEMGPSELPLDRLGGFSAANVTGGGRTMFEVENFASKNGCC